MKYLINLIKYYLGFKLLVKTKPECGDLVRFMSGVYDPGIETEKIIAVNEEEFYLERSGFMSYDKTRLEDLYWDKLEQAWSYEPWIRQRKERINKDLKGKGWKRC